MCLRNIGQPRYSDHPNWNVHNKHEYFAWRGNSTFGQYANTVKHYHHAVDLLKCGRADHLRKKASHFSMVIVPSQSHPSAWSC